MSSSGRHTRRSVLRAAGRVGLLGLAALVTAGHTPYRQWNVYRKRHLLILASKSGPAAVDHARAVAAALAAHLPDSKARSSRAGNLGRLASLIGTKQMDVTVLTRAEVADFAAGRGAFANAEPTDLRALFAFGDHVLVARADFSEAHAYLVVQTLDENRDALALGSLPDGNDGLPLHPGTLAYLEEKAEAH